MPDLTPALRALADMAHPIIGRHMTALGFSPTIKAALASCAIEGNVLAETLLETIRRLESKEPVGVTYLLGLALFLMDKKEDHHV